MPKCLVRAQAELTVSSCQKKTLTYKVFSRENLSWETCKDWAQEEILSRFIFSGTCRQREPGRGWVIYNWSDKPERIDVWLQDQEGDTLKHTRFPKSELEVLFED